MASKIKLLNSEGTTLTVSNSDLLLQDKDVIYLDTVEQLTNASGSNGDVAHVSDLDRGGVFIYDSTSTDNQGTVFGSWVRQYEGAVNIKWFGAEENAILSGSNYATKTLHDSVNGATHPSGSVYTLSKAISNFNGFEYGLYEVDIATTTSGFIKLLINGSDIFGDQPNGYPFTTETILIDGTENNRILDTTTFTFAVKAPLEGITSIGIESDTSWAGTVNSIKLYSLDINSMDLSIVTESDIGQNYATGIKAGQRSRGDMAFGDTSALMAFQYDGISPTPAYNLAVGYGALASNQRGDENTAIGSLSLNNNEGSNNTAVGYSSLKLSTKGQENTAVGYKSGISNTTGYKNTYLGFWSGVRNSTGLGNVVVGWQNNTAGISKSYVTSVGYNAGSGYSGESNVFIGGFSGNSTSGQEDISVSTATSVGNESKTRGNSSVALGYQATVGTEATLADYAISIGRNSNTTYTGNIALGYLANASGANKTIAIGQTATASGDTGSITIGESSSVTGSRAISIGQGSNAKGQQSVSLGALTVAGTGDYNTNIGGRAGLNFNGTQNTFLGWFAGNQSASYNGVTCIGQGSTVTGSNQVQLGAVGTTTYAYGAVQDRSDIRDKAEVENTQLGLDFISKLRPVEFKWDLRESYRDVDEKTGEITYATKDGSRKRNRKHQGFIAQEVKAIIEETGIDFGGFQDHSIGGGDDVMSLGYEEFIAPLVKAVQELKAEIEVLKDGK